MFRFEIPRKSTLEAWAKVSDDVMKAAIIALPLVFLKENPMGRWLAFLLLWLTVLMAAYIGDKLRTLAEREMVNMVEADDSIGE